MTKKQLAVTLLAWALVSAGASPQESETSELPGILQGTQLQRKVTDTTLDDVLAMAEKEYTHMKSERLPPSVGLLRTFLAIADYYVSLLEERPESDLEDTGLQARRLANHFKKEFNGLVSLRAESLRQGNAEGVYHLALLELAVHRCANMMNLLVMSGRGAADEKFWTAFDRYIAYGLRFGHLTPRDLSAIPERMASVARRSISGDALQTAGRANLRRGLGKLAQALRLYDKGNKFDARYRVTAGVRAFLIAAELGVPHREARQVLSSLEAELRSNDWFRSAMLEVVGLERGYAGGWPHREYRPPPEYEAREPAVESRGTISESTRVTAERPERLNPRLVATQSIGALVRHASGQPSLAEHLELAADEGLLFTGVLMDAIGESGYRELTELYLADATLPERERKGSSGYLPFRGRALLASPLVRTELVIAGRFDRVLEETRGRDTPGLWAHIGELWVERAQEEGAAAAELANAWASTLRATASWREAHHSYIRSADRFLHESNVPNWLHLAVGDTGQKVLAGRMALLSPRDGDAGVDARVARVEEANLRRMAGQILTEGFAHDMAKRVGDAYRQVVDRGAVLEQKAPPEAEDLHYAQYATALARLAVFAGGLEQESRARGFRRRLLEGPAPANGHQFFHRGVVLWDILREETKARADLRKAEEMLASEDGLRSAEAQQSIRRYLDRPTEEN